MRVERILESGSNKDRYNDIFFNRPVGPLHRRNIGILAGKHTSLHDIERVYSTVLALNHYPIIIAEQQLKPLGMPADVFLVTRDKLRYENTDEALARLAECHIIVAGLGLELGAAMQLFMERVLQTFQTQTILTESVLSFPTLEKYLSSNRMLYASTKALLKLGNVATKSNTTGLNRKFELLDNITSKLSANIVCIEKHQLLALDVGVPGKVGIVNSTDPIESTALLAILVGILADRPLPFETGWLNYALAAGYLYKEVYNLSSNPSEALKTFFDYN